MMLRALALARRGMGRVEPNPAVGCVIARGDRVLGEGYHRRFGGPHAEVEAIRSCRSSPRGATAYVTLEPCSHFGKTPPCVEALIAAGVGRVVVPLVDPNPLVNGRGIRALRRAGVRVEVGLLAEEAAELLRPFATRARLNRPYVIAKWAESAEGLLVAPPGRSKWISCEASRRRVHRLRARVDAIVAGVGTVIADDPLLTAREVPIRRGAMRVVLDSRLRIPETSRVVATADRHATVVVTSPEASRGSKADRLRKRGIEVAACRLRAGRIWLPEAMRLPMFREATNVLVEGGPTLLRSMFAAKLVDEAHVYRSRKRFRRGVAASRESAAFHRRIVRIPPPDRERRLRSGDDELRILWFDR